MLSKIAIAISFNFSFKILGPNFFVEASSYY
jgi:hypothetical protein